jgi:hypothetical protein
VLKYIKTIFEKGFKEVHLAWQNAKFVANQRFSQSKLATHIEDQIEITNQILEQLKQTLMVLQRKIQLAQDI